MARIFICYRREDSSGHAGRLYDRLRAHFGDEVFMDIDAIGPGVDYADLIDDTLEHVEVVIVVIGLQWLGFMDERGVRRLEDPEDLVRVEIEDALGRDVLVIPVLVQGARLPEPEELPSSLAALTRRNAFDVSDARWDYDLSRLITAVEHTLARGALRAGDDGVPDPAPPPGTPSPRVDIEREQGDGRPERPASTPLILAASGAGLVAVWGLAAGPGWHDEMVGIRILAAVLVVAGTAAGVVARRWEWVTVAGAAGFAGFVLWLLQLMATHDSSEYSEFVSFAQDGFTNDIVVVGAIMVFVGGRIGRRAVVPDGLAMRHRRGG